MARTATVRGDMAGIVVRRIVPCSATLLVAVSACTVGGTHDAAQQSSDGTTPRYGGVLRIVGDGDAGHLDPASGYDGMAYTVERAITRQLVTYPATGVDRMPTTLVPDLARQVPSAANGGITDGATTYTYHLRDGASWDSSPPRPVTAADVARGFERLCNPAQPTEAPGYFTSTIVGMAGYCHAFLRVPQTLRAIDAFMATHHIAGIATPDAHTVVFHLLHPTNDFNNIVALPFSSPVPAEYDGYLPNSHALAEHTISDGPYRISAYRPGVRIALVRNPAWQQSADPVRHAYVDRVEIDETVSADEVAPEITAGAADEQWLDDVPPSAFAPLLAAHDNRLVTYSAGSLAPYLVINFQSPNAERATRKLAVRQALEYAVDKAALAQVKGGAALAQPVDQVITPGNAGYRPFDLYPSAGHGGDPARARGLLASAGYPHGLTLRLLYASDDDDLPAAQVLAADLTRAGITAHLVSATTATMYGADLASPSAARNGTWDIALVEWGPDWFGNNGRTTVQPLLDGSSYGTDSTNFGDYDSGVENHLIARAVTAPTAQRAATYWHLADVQAMRDAAIVPLLVGRIASLHSTRVQHWRFDPVSWFGDVTALWLSG